MVTTIERFDRRSNTFSSETITTRYGREVIPPPEPVGTVAAIVAVTPVMFQPVYGGSSSGMGPYGGPGNSKDCGHRSRKNAGRNPTRLFRRRAGRLAHPRVAA